MLPDTTSRIRGYRCACLGGDSDFDLYFDHEGVQ